MQRTHRVPFETAERALNRPATAALRRAWGRLQVSRQYARRRPSVYRQLCESTCQQPRSKVIAAVGYARQLTASATVEDMLGCLHRAREMLELQQREQDDCQRRGDDGKLSPRLVHEVEVAVQLAQQTLLAIGSNVPLRTGVRDGFCEAGGLEAVLALLGWQQLRYHALSATVVLLGARHPPAADPPSSLRAAGAAAAPHVTEALVPLLAGGSWVIQGRTCGALTMLLRQEFHAQHGRDGVGEAVVSAWDLARIGVRWQLLHGGGAAQLAALLSSPHREVQHHAGTALSMLARFGGGFRAALLTETPLLPMLAAHCRRAAPHDIQHDAAAALVALCVNDCTVLQHHVVEAGAVAALMQLQSLAYQGPFRDDACRQLAHLAATHPKKVKPQILETPVRQPIDMGARQWNAWWVALQRDVGLVAPEPADRPAPAPASCLESY